MNYYYPHDQINLIISMLVTGFVVGIIYDVFQIKRLFFKNVVIVRFVDDFAYSIFAVVLFLLSSFLFNSGIVRWFSVVCCILGYLLYSTTLSKPVLFVMFSLVKLFHRIVKLIIMPFVLMMTLLSHPYHLIYTYFHRKSLEHKILNFH